jgi:DNA (cytosine-5)-methyltransferase 1
MAKQRGPKVLDLFSGCGGMSWGLHKAGFEIIAGIDVWHQALQTFELNHPNAEIFEGDISELSTKGVMKKLGLKKGELDVLIGGPPCQGFSKNQTASNRFIEDPRNQLYKEYMRFVTDLRPKVVVMENVAEIYNAFGGEVRNEIIETFEDLGYKVSVQVLTAADFGVPQKRRRCIFFAVRGKQVPIFPEPTHVAVAKGDMLFPLPQYVSAWEAIKDLPKPTKEADASLICLQEPETEFGKWVKNPKNLIHNHFVHKQLKLRDTNPFNQEKTLDTYQQDFVQSLASVELMEGWTSRALHQPSHAGFFIQGQAGMAIQKYPVS